MHIASAVAHAAPASGSGTKTAAAARGGDTFRAIFNTKADASVGQQSQDAAADAPDAAEQQMGDHAGRDSRATAEPAEGPDAAASAPAMQPAELARLPPDPPAAEPKRTVHPHGAPEARALPADRTGAAVAATDAAAAGVRSTFAALRPDALAAASRDVLSRTTRVAVSAARHDARTDPAVRATPDKLNPRAAGATAGGAGRDLSAASPILTGQGAAQGATPAAPAAVEAVGRVAAATAQRPDADTPAPTGGEARALRDANGSVARSGMKGGPHTMPGTAAGRRDIAPLAEADVRPGPLRAAEGALAARVAGASADITNGMANEPNARQSAGLSARYPTADATPHQTRSGIEMPSRHVAVPLSSAVMPSDVRAVDGDAGQATEGKPVASTVTQRHGIDGSHPAAVHRTTEGAIPAMGSARLRESPHAFASEPEADQAPRMLRPSAAGKSAVTDAPDSLSNNVFRLERGAGPSLKTSSQPPAPQVAGGPAAIPSRAHSGPFPVISGEPRPARLQGDPSQTAHRTAVGGDLRAFERMLPKASAAPASTSLKGMPGSDSVPAAAVKAVPAATVSALAAGMDRSDRDPGPTVLESFGAAPLNAATPNPTTGAAMSSSDLHGPRVAWQIAESIAQAPDRTSELMLAPEELGRLRFGIVTTEHGVTVQIAAERPETLDLVRRHLDHLAEDLRRMGFGGVTIDLGSGESVPDGRAGDQRRAPGPPAAADSPAPVRPDAPPGANPSDGTSGLDLRL